MDSSSDQQLSASRSINTFVTPSTSAGTLTDKLSKVKIVTENPSCTKRGTKRPNSPSSSADKLMPAGKKNRDYLPTESKPVYFDLKKQFKQKSKWAAHEQFMNNCAESGNFPRSIQYKCAPPWQFTNPELTHQWATTQQQAPAELCKLISLDCKARLVNCQASIDALLVDLKKLIPETDFKDIQSELQHDYTTASDRLYAEKLLGRTNANKPRGNPTPNAPSKKNPRATRQPQPKGRQPRGRSRPRNRGRGNQQSDNTATVRSRPGAVKQDLMRQLNELSKAIKQMK